MNNTTTLFNRQMKVILKGASVGLFFFLMITVTPSFGQSQTAQEKSPHDLEQAVQTYKGQVLDQGEPLPGANIYSKSTGNGTVTDLDGYFTLVGAKSGEVYICSFIGYDSKEFIIPENPEQFIEVQMEGRIVLTGSLQVVETEKPGLFKKMKHTIARIF